MHTSPLATPRAPLSLFLSVAIGALGLAACSTTPPIVDPEDGGMVRPCDPRCGEGEVCDDGVCVCGARRSESGPVCGDGTACCGSSCRAIFGDVRNCGTCDNDCTTVPGAGEVSCVGGTCVIDGCAEGFLDCPGDGPGCATTMGPRACGACDNVCGAGETCTDSGRCACGGSFAPPGGGSVCPEGTACCDGACVELTNNDDHCGACGITCTGRTSCCGTVCADTFGSAAHCGGCGLACEDEPNVVDGICRSGGCVATACDRGFLDCPGDGPGCQTIQDENNCGACGNVCAPGQGCTAMGVCGRCESDAECAAGRTCCDGDCVDLSSSASNCGACGVLCEFPNSEGATCSGSACAFGACSEGFLDCDGNSSNGCEVPFGASSCGACGVTCGASERCNELGSCACGVTTGAPGTGPACASTESCIAGECIEGCMPFPGGATDTFGYTGCSEVMPVADLPCPDISATGTPLMLSDDGQANDIPLGFDLDFYGVTRSVVNINANGAMVFNSTGLGFSNACLPTMSAPRVIAAWWDDLNPAAGGSVRYQSLGTAPDRSFAVRWSVPRFRAGTDPIGVTAVIHESGDIEVCYDDTDVGSATYNDGASATIGIAGQGHQLQYSCNTASVTDGTLLRYTHP